MTALRLGEITALIGALHDRVAAVCNVICEMLADVFSACWAREDATATESADVQMSARRVREEALGALVPLRRALGEHMARLGLETMD